MSVVEIVDLGLEGHRIIFSPVSYQQSENNVWWIFVGWEPDFSLQQPYISIFSIQNSIRWNIAPISLIEWSLQITFPSKLESRRLDNYNLAATSLRFPVAENSRSYSPIHKIGSFIGVFSNPNSHP